MWPVVKSHLRYTPPAANKAQKHVFLNVDVKHETENLGFQANRFPHIMTDESYRTFILSDK